MQKNRTQMNECPSLIQPKHTKHKGSKINITNTRQEHKVILSYDYLNELRSESVTVRNFAGSVRIDSKKRFQER